MKSMNSPKTKNKHCSRAFIFCGISYVKKLIKGNRSENRGIIEGVFTEEKNISKNSGNTRQAESEIFLSEREVKYIYEVVKSTNNS